VPCKHLAATFYLLAEHFDEDPFAILLWRGRSRDALLSRLRDLRGSDTLVSPEPVQPTVDGPRVGAMTALAELALADRSFWTSSPLPPLPVQADLPTDLLLRQLPVPAPALGGVELVAYLAPLYAKLGEQPDDQATGE
jgi:uncharacterized Zn finger protein